jgi:serine O-acetyltransferase
MERVTRRALERVERCFSRIALRGYRDAQGIATFDHLHGDQFASFLYLAANSAWCEFEDEPLARKLTLLNRARHALVVMPDTKLPEIFVIPHTVGTVIGKGSYGNYSVFCQNVTIANDITTYLSVGEGVVFFPGAFVVGRGSIGEGAIITANSTVSYCDVPAHTMVRGTSPHLEMWPRKRDFLARYFTPPYPGSEE